jgi:hypothetical protein
MSDRCHGSSMGPYAALANNAKHKNKERILKNDKYELKMKKKKEL